MALATPSAAAVQATSAEPVAHALSPAEAHLLTRIDLFARLDRVALARLAACAEALPIQAGEEVCRVGDLAEGLYVVAEGTFGVYGAGPERRGAGAARRAPPRRFLRGGGAAERRAAFGDRARLRAGD